MPCPYVFPWILRHGRFKVICFYQISDAVPLGFSLDFGARQV
ncbi:hypothetical protein [Microseira wollei]|nr:hypothetical protein [Microseira wollei]